MKKILKLILVAILVITMSATVSAAENILRVRNVTAKKGDTVYVTVELTKSIRGDAVGISYTYDEDKLTPVVDSCEWVRKGMMQDFDLRNHKGVWTVSQCEDLKGGVCILVFKLNDKANFAETSVTCTLVVKDAGEKVGTYTAKGKIIVDCEHTYGEWSDSGNIGHIRTCKLCKGTQTRSHQWNAGTVTKVPSSGASVRTYTCQVCGGTMTHTTSEQALTPTSPEYSSSTTTKSDDSDSNDSYEFDNEHEHTHDNVTSENNEHSHDETTGTTTSTQTQNHDHEHDGDSETATVDSEAEDHNHTNSEQSTNGWLNLSGIFVVIAILVVMAFYFIKRKKKQNFTVKKMQKF